MSGRLSEPAPVRRLTSLPLPAYRYLPGSDPHPLTDADGHGGIGRWIDTDTPDGRAHCYAYGCDLFNHGYWWECHEAWEALWHTTGRKGPQAQVLQALIQMANAHLKRRMGRPRAAARLVAMALEHGESALARDPDPVPGLALRPWLNAHQRFLLERGAGLSFPYLEPAGSWKTDL